MSMYGWCGKILRVNLSDGRISVEELQPRLAKDYIGGRGLGSKYLFDEVDPKVDPLSPENKLILAAGAISGTHVPTGGRYMVITKGALTGTIASSNSGGFWGAELKHAGYDMIIVEGKAEELVYLWLKDDKAELRSAKHISGKNTFETQDIVRQETDKTARITCIGPAGEKLVKFACLINDEGRAPGRSGVGAVMGSKGLKAVAVRGTKEVPVADERGLKDVTRQINKILSGGPLKKYGTCYSVRFTNGAGVLPTRNFRTGVFEGAENICGEVINEQFVVRTSACYRCPMGCGRIAKVIDSGFEGEGPGPEYEGVFSLGSCCGVNNAAAIIKAFQICNELGMDVISCGVTIACAMEMCEEGVISEKDVGFKLNFGDARALVELVKRTGNRDGFGDALAEGSKRLAEKYGHPEFSMNVKGQEPAGYEPRGLQGMALAYATSNRGACHLRGEISNAEVFGLPFKLDGLATQGKAAYLIDMQNEAASIDSMGICWLCSSYRIGKKNQLDALELVTGAGYDWEEFIKVGERIWNLERLYNNKAGFTEADDTLPRRFLVEPLPEGPTKGAVARLGEMIFEYYMLRGWTTEGKPTRRKLLELGLEV